MSIKSTYISQDITKDDDKLSFNVQNTIEYEFVIGKDLYLDDRRKPLGVVNGNESTLQSKLRAGYSLKKVAEQDITVEVTADANENPFHTRNIQMEYYVQTLTDTDDGTSFDTDDGDTNTEGSIDRDRTLDDTIQFEA